MNNGHLDIGTIQAYLDGELSHEETGRLTGHASMCDACAFMIADAEEESSLVFGALERELDSLVPTQRLWNKINDSIELDRGARPAWRRTWAFFRLTLLNPSFAAAASLILVVGVVAILWINKSSTLPVNDVALAPRSSGSVTSPTVSSPNVGGLPSASVLPDTKGAETAAVTSSSRVLAPAAERASYRAAPAGYQKAAYTTPRQTGPLPLDASGFMPGEESYVKTISALSKNISAQKDTVLRPSERIAYERDMAVVNDTIAKLRTEVKRDPRNDSARQILYTSYQNKIDLMNSVTQKEELVASLK